MATSDKDLDVRDSSNPFIAALVSRQKWEGTDKFAITYSFTKDQNPKGETLAWTRAEKIAFRDALDSLEAIIDVEFKEVASNQDPNLEWRVINKNLSTEKGALGYHYSPDGSGEAGDGYFVRDQHKNWSGQIDPGGYAYTTIIHEIGHGLGLDHPHDGSPKFPGVKGKGDPGTKEQNLGLFTVMSYNDLGRSFEGKQVFPTAQEKFGFVDGPMAFDIAALQYLYGANADYAAGADGYALKDANAAWHCVWDTGGVDSIDYAGAKNATIDLRAATLDKASPNAGGFLSRVDGLWGGLTIANGVVIENASGGSGNDSMTGNAAANRLAGAAGGDTLKGLDGDDTILPGVGKNDVDGGAGVDWVDFSDLGVGVEVVFLNNTISGPGVSGSIKNVENMEGSQSADTLSADDDANVFDGNGGNDVVAGRGGKDTLDGGAGSRDIVSYELDSGTVTVRLDGDNWVFVNRGGAAEDRIRGFEDVRGSTSGDSIAGDGQANLLQGGKGDDTLQGGGGIDTLDGGDSYDTANLSDQTKALIVTLDEASDATVFGDRVADDVLKGIENLVGGKGGDLFTGNSGRNRLDGGLGADTLVGTSGADTLDGGDGVDLADFNSFTAANKLVVTLGGAGEGSVTINGKAGSTLLSIENARGGQGDDLMSGDDRVNVLTGGFGDDTIVGGGGVDELDGQNGVDTLNYRDETTSVSVQLKGSDAAIVTVDLVLADRVRNFEKVIGGSGGDFLYGDGEKNLFAGFSGDDVLRGGAGFDTLDGGSGVDTADFSKETKAVKVTLNGFDPSIATVGGSGADQLFSIENVVGGSVGDVLNGDAFANRLDGGAGDDELNGQGGDDVLFGGAGFDRLTGGDGLDTADYTGVSAALKVTLATGNTFVTLKAFDAKKGTFVNEDNLKFIEKLIGGSGADEFDGSIGDDVLFGGFGDDTLDGYYGDDVIRGGFGKDSLDGGAEDDDDHTPDVDFTDYGDKTAAITVTLTGSVFANVTVGGAVEDSIRNFEGVLGGFGNDTITGDAGQNLLYGGEGDDSLNGGEGRDTLSGGAGLDRMDGGPKVYTDINGNPFVNFDQVDAVDLSYDARGFTLRMKAIDLSNQTLFSAILFKDGERDLITRIEDVIGGAGADSIYGNDVVNHLSGGGRSDLLDGGAADDYLTGGEGQDTLIGGEGTDFAVYDDRRLDVEIVLQDNGRSTVFVGGKAEDAIEKIEGVIGGSGADKFTGNAQVNLFFGGDGADTFVGSAGRDQFQGGAGVDLADYSKSTDDINVYLRYDTTTSFPNGYMFVGTELKDVLNDVDNLKAGSGSDNLRGGAGANAIDGGGGNDLLYGLGGDDVLTGGSGADKFVFGGLAAASTTVLLNVGDIGLDRVTDFNAAEDLLRIDLRTFDPENKLSALTADNFGTGGSIADKGTDDILFYGKNDGKLWFDLDAGESGAAVNFAILTTNLNLGFSNFEIFDPA